MIRLDMSEFNSYNSVEKLIGNNTEVGELSKKLRENPYGVILLDEFEKAHPNVHDLFLQILDEGSFMDFRGEKIDAKNTIIIATTNAESDLIFKLSTENKNLSLEKNLIIEKVIQDQIFKPELLNRFDGIIFFYPLSIADLKEVAKLMIDKLNARLKNKGLEIVYNSDCFN